MKVKKIEFHLKSLKQVFGDKSVHLSRVYFIRADGKVLDEPAFTESNYSAVAPAVACKFSYKISDTENVTGTIKQTIAGYSDSYKIENAFDGKTLKNDVKGATTIYGYYTQNAGETPYCTVTVEFDEEIDLVSVNYLPMSVYGGNYFTDTSYVKVYNKANTVVLSTEDNPFVVETAQALLDAYELSEPSQGTENKWWYMFKSVHVSFTSVEEPLYVNGFFKTEDGDIICIGGGSGSTGGGGAITAPDGNIKPDVLPPPAPPAQGEDKDPNLNTAKPGAVKLSDRTDFDSDVSKGIASTPKAVKLTMDIAKLALAQAGGTLDPAQPPKVELPGSIVNPANDTKLGTVKLSDATNSSADAATGQTAASSKAVMAAMDKATEALRVAQAGGGGQVVQVEDASNDKKGIVSLSDATDSTLDAASGKFAATPKAVKAAMDKAVEALALAGGNTQGQPIEGQKIEPANNTKLGVVKLSDETASNLTAADGKTAASPKAVMAAYDLANQAFKLAQANAGQANGGNIALPDDANAVRKGVVKLSDAVNSDSGIDGITAATPKAVKTALEQAKAYTDTQKGQGSSADATDTVKGINKLSDSLDSDLNAATGATAATPKAVKEVMNVAKLALATAGGATKPGQTPNIELPGNIVEPATDKKLGTVKLSDATNSSSDAATGNTAASSKAVMEAMDKANEALRIAQAGGGGQVVQAQDASNTQKGIVSLSDATDSDLDATNGKFAATPKAVKAAMDKAKEALALAGGNTGSGTIEGTKIDSATDAKLGVVKLTDETASNLDAKTGTTAASPKAVMKAYDLANQALKLAQANAGQGQGGGGSIALPDDANATRKGVVKLSDAINSNNSIDDITAATPKAVKTVNDKVGDLATLKTTAKDSVVEAINEVKANQGQSATDTCVKKTGDRGSLAGYEQVHNTSNSTTINKDSPDNILIKTTGSTTLTFTEAEETYTCVKVITLYAQSSSNISVSGATWINNGSAPSWGNSGETLILLAHFCNGKVRIAVFHNDRS